MDDIDSRADQRPFEWGLPTSSESLRGVNIKEILLSIGEIWKMEERSFECRPKKPFKTLKQKSIRLIGDTVVGDTINIPCQDHTRYVKDPRDDRFCMCIIEPYNMGKGCLESLIAFCEDRGLTFTIDGRSSHFPGACIRIIIKKRME